MATISTRTGRMLRNARIAAGLMPKEFGNWGVSGKTIRRLESFGDRFIEYEHEPWLVRTMWVIEAGLMTRGIEIAPNGIICKLEALSFEQAMLAIGICNGILISEGIKLPNRWVSAKTIGHLEAFGDQPIQASKSILAACTANLQVAELTLRKKLLPSGLSVFGKNFS